MSISCTHPLKGFQIGWTENNKPNYRIVPYRTDHIELTHRGWINCYDNFVSPNSKRVIRDWTLIPCGNCIQCRIKYSRDWAQRCVLESRYHDNNYFITLTYDQDNVPKRYFIDENGKECLVHPLDKKDLQLFLKRLRKWYSKTHTEKLRFMACGEYGEKYGRCHFHIVVFGLDIPDLQMAEPSHPDYKGRSNLLYRSDTISRIWGKGLVRIGECSYDSCAYVARYVVKKHKGKDANFYEKTHLTPEFIVMSRKPGLAYQYFEEHKDHIYEFDQICFGNKEKVIKAKPCRYYDKLFDIEDPNRMAEIKEKRKLIGENAQKLVKEKTSLDQESYNGVLERNLTQKLKAVERRIE